MPEEPEPNEQSQEETQIIPSFFPDWGELEIDSVHDALNGDVLANNQKSVEFEKAFASFVNASYCVIFPSHELAMFCALTVMKPRLSTQSIIIPSIGGQSIYNAAVLARYNPVLGEVEKNGSLNLRDNQGGVVYHLNGRLGKPSLIEDCRDIPTHHTKNMVSVYDFSSRSHITLGGTGGAVCCDDPDVYTALLRIKHDGKDMTNENEVFSDNGLFWGLDLGVSELQAAFGLAQLKLLPPKLDRIKAMQKILVDGLKNTVDFLEGDPLNRLEILVTDAKETSLRLMDKGILTEFFPRPLHLQKYTSLVGRLDNSFPISDALYMRGLLLPSLTMMSDEDLKKVIDIIKSVMNES